MAKNVRTMDNLFIEQIRDLLDAEKQLTKALPKMAKASSSQELQNAFNDHLEQTRTHVQRLETLFTSLGEKPSGVKCKAMAGLIEEGEEIVCITEAGMVRDAGLIAAAQRVEHYEMSGYGSARAFAQLLNRKEAADLLKQTLDEEKEADRLLNQIAGSMVNEGALSESGGSPNRTGRAGGGL